MTRKNRHFVDRRFGIRSKKRVYEQIFRNSAALTTSPGRDYLRIQPSCPCSKCIERSVIGRVRKILHWPK